MADARAKRDWRTAAALAGPGAGKKSGLFSAALTAVTLIGLLAGLAWWLFFQPPLRAPHVVGIPLSELPEPWPPTPFARADVDLLKRFDSSLANIQEKFGTDLAVNLRTSPADRPLVVYISGLSVGWHGKAYVLSAGAGPPSADPNWEPQRGSGWTELDDVLDAVREAPTTAGKFLVLDLCHPTAGLENGILADRAADIIHRRLNERQTAGELPMLVLVSAGPGEVSWPMPEVRCSAVAFFLKEGWDGAAGAGDDESGWRVMARGLADHVCRRVSDWSSKVGGARQSPYTVGGDDFLMAFQRQKPAPAEAQKVPMPAWLGQAWQQRDAVAHSGPRRVVGPAAADWERAVLAADESFRAGQAAEQSEPATLTLARSALSTRMPRAAALKPQPPTWLDNSNIDEAAVALVKPILDASAQTADTKSIPPEQVLAALWQGLCNRPITDRAHFVAIVAFAAKERDRARAEAREAELKKPKDGKAAEPKPDDKPKQTLYAEIAFLETVRAAAESAWFRDVSEKVKARRQWAKVANAVMAAAQAERAYLRTMNTASPDGFGWFRKDLDHLNTERAAAESKLVRLGDADLVDYEAAADLLATDYRKIRQTAADLEAMAVVVNRAAACWAEAVAELPGYAPTLARLEPDDAKPALGPWRSAVDKTVTLAGLFSESASGGPVPAELSVTADGLRGELDRLGKWFVEERNKGLSNVRAAAILASPRLSAAERAAYWEEWQKFCTDRTNTFLAAENVRTPDGQRSAEASDEARRADVRAQVAVGLAALAGRPLPGIDADLQVLRDQQDPDAWNQFAPRLATRGRSGHAASAAADAASAAAAAPWDEYWSWRVGRYKFERERRGMTARDDPFYEKAIEFAEAAGRLRP